MNIITSSAIAILAAHGYHVRGPNDPPDDVEALRRVKALGYQVFPPLAVPAPGMSWMPTRQRFTIPTKHLKGWIEVPPFELRKLAVRKVDAATPTHVTFYYPGGLEWRETITLRSWHNWRRRMRAKVVE